MRDQNRGAALHDSAQAVENALFGLRVDARERVVKDKDPRVADYGAGNGGALLLPAGESDAALADHGFVGFTEVLDVTVQAGNFGCFADALLVIFRQAEGDVPADGFAKQISVLRDEADGLTQSGERPFADGTAVDQDAVVGRFPETRDESGERRFAAACGADDGESGASGDFQMNVAQHGMRSIAVGFGGAIGARSGKRRRVSKGEMAEFDFAARLGAFRNFRVAVVNIGLGGEDVIEPAHGSSAALKDIRDPSKGDHGPDEQSEISVEGNQRAERNLAAEELVAALPEDDQECS